MEAAGIDPASAIAPTPVGRHLVPAGGLGLESSNTGFKGWRAYRCHF